MVTRHTQHCAQRCTQHQGTGTARRGHCQRHRVAEIISRCRANANLIGTRVITERALDFDEVEAVGTRCEISTRIERAAKIIGLEEFLASGIVNDDQRVCQGVQLGCGRQIAHGADHVHLALGEPGLEPVAVTVVGDQALHRRAGQHHAGGLDVVAKIIGQRGARQGVSALASVTGGARVEVIPTGICGPINHFGVTAAAAVVILRQQDAGD